MLLATISFLMVGCNDDVIESNIASHVTATRALAGSDYYWYNGQQITIAKVENKEFILFNSSYAQSLTSSNNLKTLVEPHDVTLSSNIQQNIKTSGSLKWAIVESPTLVSTALNSNANIVYQAPCFKSIDGKELGLGYVFYAKLKSAKDLSELESLASKNNVTILGNNKFMPLWYTLSCTKESLGNALEMANKFYETGFFASCEPDFISTETIICDGPNDPLFSKQWNLANIGQNGGTAGIDINYVNASNVTKGSGDIMVAVIDQGIELSHPDLNIYAKSYNTESGTSPSVVYGGHATCCAGIIAAKTDNNLGVAGIAPNCPLMSISNPMMVSTDLNQKLADGFNYAWKNGASVISNSWYSPTKQQILDDAISNALTLGRNGLGCVVAFASGNFNSSVIYPANSNPDILAVGAMSPCGQRKSPSSCDGENWGSDYGNELDIVAPGVFITTTDLTGSGGYVDGDYTYRFNGTSSACPHVAATAALVLSVNPGLTQKQVSNIIERTAKKLDGYSYVTTSNRSNGTWNNETGYGLLNAFAAVSSIVRFTDQSVSSSKTVAGSDIYSSDVTVTNGSKLTFVASSSVTINKSFSIEKGSQLEISH